MHVRRGRFFHKSCVIQENLYLCLCKAQPSLNTNPTKMDLTIHIKKGIGDLLFDMPVERVVELWGEADDVENIDNAADETTTLLHYPDVTLFFEGENPTLSCVDISHPDSTLLGKKIFELSEKEVVKLMVDNQYYEQDVDNEAWGERRVTFNEGNIDFYFEGATLISVLIGK